MSGYRPIRRNNNAFYRPTPSGGLRRGKLVGERAVVEA
jgi:hypothetical protein